MFLYKPKGKFDPDTGKPIDPVLRQCGFICDYTGEVIDCEENYEVTPLYTLEFKYNDDSEPIWYYDKERTILEKGYHIGYGEYSQWLESPYHFIPTEGIGYTDQSLHLIEEWMRNRQPNANKKLPFRDCRTIEQAFREARIRTLVRVLEEKKFTPQQLGFDCNADY